MARPDTESVSFETKVEVVRKRDRCGRFCNRTETITVTVEADITPGEDGCGGSTDYATPDIEASAEVTAIKDEYGEDVTNILADEDTLSELRHEALDHGDGGCKPVSAWTREDQREYEAEMRAEAAMDR